MDEIAKELNMSKSNLKRALRIERNLTDSMKELLDSGEITKTFASDTIASLSEDEQTSKHKFNLPPYNNPKSLTYRKLYVKIELNKESKNPYRTE